MNDREAKEKVINAGIRLVESGLIARTWGNVSCRISDSHFVISPSGRDYLSLTPEEIVTVAIADLSYTGNIKPSSEKGIHAEIYKHDPNINFVIHTHQENASVISTMELDSIRTDLDYPLLGNEIVCASYGLPGTKKLRKGVAEALNRSKGNAIIMMHHGAVCFGKDDEEAFQVASDLEEVCIHFVAERYKNINHDISFDPIKMRRFVLEKISHKWKSNGYDLIRPYSNSERTSDGFILHRKDCESVQIKTGEISKDLPKEAQIHNEIYLKNKKINYIMHEDSPNILTISRANITLYPLVDDFAQIIGTKVKTALINNSKIANALKNADAVMIGNNGALCCGVSQGDAIAVHMIMEKNCKALICGTLFGVMKPISWIDRNLMRFVYQIKYSKQISSNEK